MLAWHVQGPGFDAYHCLPIMPEVVAHGYNSTLGNKHRKISSQGYPWLYGLGQPGLQETVSQKKTNQSLSGRVAEKIKKILGWRDGSEVKITDCSSRGPEFNSQQLHSGSQPSVMASNGLLCV